MGCAEFPERGLTGDTGATDVATPMDAGRRDAGDAEPRPDGRAPDGDALDGAPRDALGDAGPPLDVGVVDEGADDGAAPPDAAGPEADAARPDAARPDAAADDGGSAPTLVIDGVAPAAVSAVGDAAFRATVVQWHTGVVGEVGVFVGDCEGAPLPGSAVDHAGGDGATTLEASDLAEGPNALIVCARVAGHVVAEGAFAVIRDDTPPAAPEDVLTRPAGPSTDQSVTLAGVAEPGGAVEVHTDADCPAPAGQGLADAQGGFAVADIPVARDAETAFYMVLRDGLGNRSVCYGPVAT